MEITDKPMPHLEAAEQRIIGAMIEKSKTTPDYYPMTLNGLTAACNQKSARNPVVNYSEETVALTLNTLKNKGLVATATGGASRVTKWKHNLGLLYGVLPDELAVICLLLLRGPLTPGEINSNAGRLFEFENIEEVNEVLQRLSTTEHPVVKQLERKPGQKESRFIHLLGDQHADVNIPDNPQSSNTDLEERLACLEREIAEMKVEIELLMSK